MRLGRSRRFRLGRAPLATGPFVRCLWRCAFGADASRGSVAEDVRSMRSERLCHRKNDPVTLFAFGPMPSAVGFFAPTPSALAPPSSLGFAFGGRNAFASRMLLRQKKKRQRSRMKSVPLPRAPSAVSDWEQVLGRCAGEEGDLLFECESVQVTKEEEISFGALFKNSKSSKNGYKTCDYKDRMRRNVVEALLQILQLHRTTYMTSCQVRFVELALTGTPIHRARILRKATRQHAQDKKGGSINHLSPFLINFYRSMVCLTASERVQFSLLSRSNPGRYVKDVEVDNDTDETLTCTPPARPRAEEEPRAIRVPRKRKWDGEADQSQREVPVAPARSRAIHEPSSRPKQEARKLVLLASSADTGRAVE
ncbi:hypothetical protein AXG93_1660s1270 [Marchantia polymorpha subsp. ruderalis]|uniref:Uncharacterized protein n=1 Tax=Marchantia polymorpha subsp. ruderalis TaxID=1480154 RepID=A0A176VR55_MARPO|nr:hypothetical protein AXG93_1660s1270 [Marchantia polymorpha subsp. ruderalis]